MAEYISDKNINRLLGKVVLSFRASPDSHRDDEESLKQCIRDPSTSPPAGGFARDDNREIGLPLGNLTSQLFSNIYLNVFDQFVKHKLKTKYYIRYVDDFVFLSTDKKYLENLIPEIRKLMSGGCTIKTNSA